jgi:hypothetical protein
MKKKLLDAFFKQEHPIISLYTKTQEQLHDFLCDVFKECGYELTTSPTFWTIATPKKEDADALFFLGHLDVSGRDVPKAEDIYYTDSEAHSVGWGAQMKKHTGPTYGLKPLETITVGDVQNALMLCKGTNEWIDNPNKTIVKKVISVPANSSCLGADNRNSAYMMLELLRRGHRPFFGLFWNEEIGCIGSSRFSTDIVEPKHNKLKNRLNNECNMIIQSDRGSKGCFNEVVYYEETNPEFMTYIESFGFTRANGSISDVKLVSSALNLPSCNIANGYVSEHSRTEKCLFDLLLQFTDNVENIIIDIKKSNTKFEKMRNEAKWAPSNYDYNSYKITNNHFNQVSKGWYDEYDEYDESNGDLPKTIRPTVEDWWNYLPEDLKEGIMADYVGIALEYLHDEDIEHYMNDFHGLIELERELDNESSTK